MEQSSNYLKVSITGHRDLLQEDKPEIKRKIEWLFNKLRNAYGCRIKLFSALAPGADIWAAECLNISDKLVIVKVLPDDIDKKYTFEGNNEVYRVSREFENRRNTKVISLIPKHNQGFDNNWVVEEQFRRLGEYLVVNTDFLIALWDGIDGGGVGGTSDVVSMWIKRKSIDGKSVNHTKSFHTLFHLPVKRSKNHFPITRKFSKYE